MERRSIGSLQVSVVGLGCNNLGMRLDEEASIRVVHAAIDAGVSLFDTADIYGDTRSEEFLGRAVAGRRDEVVIASKFGMRVQEDPARSGASAAWVARAVEDSLRRLGIERIDLYQLHRPDPATPIEETLGALDELVRAGKVGEIGHSNLSGEQMREAERTAAARGTARFVCAQNRYSLLAREAEDDVLPACAELGLAFLPYFPLASGMLTGKYRRGEAASTRLGSVPAERAAAILSERNFTVVERLEAWAADHGRTVLDLAIAWLAATSPVASVIAGATTPEQVERNVAAASWSLTRAERDEVSALAAG